MAVGGAVVLGVRLVNRDDVEMAVAVEIPHLESVAAADRHAAQCLVVDDVFTATRSTVRPRTEPWSGVGDQVRGGIGFAARRAVSAAAAGQERRRKQPGGQSGSRSRGQTLWSVHARWAHRG